MANNSIVPSLMPRHKEAGVADCITLGPYHNGIVQLDEFETKAQPKSTPDHHKEPVPRFARIVEYPRIRQVDSLSKEA